MTEKIFKGCLLFLFFVSSSFGQIKLNNSLFFYSLDTKPNLSRFSIFDFNEDGLNDFILYGNGKKEIVIHRSLRDSSVSHAIDKFFYYPVTDIKHIRKREDFGSFYVIISEQNRLAALTSFTKYGTLLMLNKLKFDYAPSGMLIEDYNKDGEKEIYVYGVNFKGISSLTIDNFILRETRITDEGIYPDLFALDYDYDEYTDLMGYEILDNNLVFFQNQGGSNFELVRKKRLPFNPQRMLAGDYNNDGYIDLAFVYNNKISMFVGDSVSSFTKFYTKSVPFKIADFFDFNSNGDKYTDFLFISAEDSSLLLSINNNGKLEDPVTLVSGEKIVDVKIQEDRISALSSKGKIFTQLTIHNKAPKTFLSADELFNDMNNVNLTDLVSFPFKNSKENSIVLTYGHESLDSFGYYPVEGNYSSIASIASKRNDYHFIYKSGTNYLELLRLKKSNWKVYKRAGFFVSDVLGLLPIYRGSELFGGMIWKDSTAAIKMSAIDLFSNSKNLLDFADTNIVLPNQLKRYNKGSNIFLEDSNDVSYVFALKGSTEKDTINIKLNNGYLLASQIKGKYIISRNKLHFFYSGKKTATVKLKRKYNVGLWSDENIKYYEIDGYAQYLFINIPELYRMYMIKVDLLSGKHDIRTLIDSKKIIKYIVRRIHNNMFLFYKTTGFDKIMVRELE